LSDLLGQLNAMIDWMPVEDPAFIGDQVRHDRNPLRLLRHSGESRNPECMSPYEIKIAQFR